MGPHAPHARHRGRGRALHPPRPRPPRRSARRRARPLARPLRPLARAIARTARHARPQRHACDHVRRRSAGRGPARRPRPPVGCHARRDDGRGRARSLGRKGRGPARPGWRVDDPRSRPGHHRAAAAAALQARHQRPAYPARRRGDRARLRRRSDCRERSRSARAARGRGFTQYGGRRHRTAHRTDARAAGHLSPGHRSLGERTRPHPRRGSRPREIGHPRRRRDHRGGARPPGRRDRPLRPLPGGAVMARHLRKSAELGLEAITIERALIAPEQVAKIAATARDGKAAAGYDIPKGLTLGEEIARYFRIGQAIWRDYDRIDSPTATQTAEFVGRLLVQAFGFDDLTGPHEHREGTRRYRIAWEARQGHVPIVVAAPAGDEKGRDVGFTRALPEFGDGAEGRAKRSPIVLLQDWLNANTGFYWGLVFAGDKARLRRDKAGLTRRAWIEAGLGALFRHEMSAACTAWWLRTHASRFGATGAPPSSAPLEEVREAGLRQGTAARERLREGVESALSELGQGLVEANPAIRERLASDAAATSALFEELLRTVYRLIFLAVAEDRDLLHPRTTGQKARDLYAENYSFAFWRQRSTRLAAYDAHHDAWEGMKVTLAALEQGQPLLGLPALGGLFARGATPMLGEARIPNRRFLRAIYSLGFIRVDSQRH